MDEDLEDDFEDEEVSEDSDSDFDDPDSDDESDEQYMAYMCKGKKRYFSKKDAITQINFLMKRRGRHGISEFLRCYPCPYCKQWHLTKLKDWNDEEEYDRRNENKIADKRLS